MKVVQTERVRKQIEAYKRFLEKPVLFNHTVQLNNQHYYIVQYWRWGKNQAVGYILMRPDGELLPRTEAIPVMKLFLFHNAAVHKFLRDFAVDKEKPVWVFEQILTHLHSLLPHYENQLRTETRQEIQQLMDVCTHMVESRDKLRNIYDRGLEKHNQMLARGYVVPDDLTSLHNALYESDFVLYERLRKQELVWAPLEHVTQFFQQTNVSLSRELEKQKKSLLKLLSSYKRNSIKKITETSVNSFERNLEGRNIVFQSVEQLKELYQKEDEILFQRDTVPILRNP